MLFMNLLAAFDNLNPMDWKVLEPALNFLWQGLLAIFVVIGLIIVVVKITAFAIAKCDEAKKRREEETNANDNPNV
ncbi:MAG: hypothetical protein J6D30_00670 [Clostridia bacterium]|nr:hypothetical protein [Clostridia bacterium]